MQQRNAGLYIDLDGVGDRLEVYVDGELDLVASAQLVDRVREIDVPAQTILDLRDVTFMDSTGLRALWLLQQRSAARHGEFVLRRPSNAVLRVLDVSGLRDQFTLLRA